MNNQELIDIVHIASERLKAHTGEPPSPESVQIELARMFAEAQQIILHKRTRLLVCHRCGRPLTAVDTFGDGRQTVKPCEACMARAEEIGIEKSCNKCLAGGAA